MSNIKYKLIKEYPGSPDLGTTITFTGPARIVWADVPEYPEFWEKVKEKTSEILSYYAKNIAGKGDHHVDPDYIWKETYEGSNQWSRGGNQTLPYSTEVMSTHNGYGIHSVKRLSDGEVFTLGDVVDFSISKKIKITGFKIMSSLNHMSVLSNNSLDRLPYIKKVKQPIFKTYDGVDIFEKDKYFVILIGDAKFQIYAFECNASSGKDLKCMYFSTRESAEEYILLNKPCLSIQEICPIIGECNYTSYIDLNLLTKKLINLVKSKQ